MAAASKLSLHQYRCLDETLFLRPLTSEIASDVTIGISHPCVQGEANTHFEDSSNLHVQCLEKVPKIFSQMVVSW